MLQQRCPSDNLVANQPEIPHGACPSGSWSRLRSTRPVRNPKPLTLEELDLRVRLLAGSGGGNLQSSQLKGVQLGGGFAFSPSGSGFRLYFSRCSWLPTMRQRGRGLSHRRAAEPVHEKVPAGGGWSAS